MNPSPCRMPASEARIRHSLCGEKQPQTAAEYSGQATRQPDRRIAVDVDTHIHPRDASAEKARTVGKSDTSGALGAVQRRVEEPSAQRDHRPDTEWSQTERKNNASQRGYAPIGDPVEHQSVVSVASVVTRKRVSRRSSAWMTLNSN